MLYRILIISNSKPRESVCVLSYRVMWAQQVFRIYLVVLLVLSGIIWREAIRLVSGCARWGNKTVSVSKNIIWCTVNTHLSWMSFGTSAVLLVNQKKRHFLGVALNSTSSKHKKTQSVATEGQCFYKEQDFCPGCCCDSESFCFRISIASAIISR